MTDSNRTEIREFFAALFPSVDFRTGYIGTDTYMLFTSLREASVWGGTESIDLPLKDAGSPLGLARLLWIWEAKTGLQAPVSVTRTLPSPCFKDNL